MGKLHALGNNGTDSEGNGKKNFTLRYELGVLNLS